MAPRRLSLAARARAIRMVLLDVDGVLTDGGLYYSAEGQELKRFHAHDGYGIRRGKEAGLTFGIISGRSTPIVEARAKVLSIEEVVQGAEDKVLAMREIQRRHGYRDAEFAFIGDDLFDIPLLRAVGLSAAPTNALPRVKRVVHYVTRVAGGEGAVRDFVDMILAYRGI
ncbi:MAG TPA: HAD-IIIA family hydrolase [Bacteroidota bacterium]|nr:HAD-IIIA family hydrolase [Bacteroidota bacterium]